jgi:hypothetical protein
VGHDGCGPHLLHTKNAQPQEAQVHSENFQLGDWLGWSSSHRGPHNVQWPKQEIKQVGNCGFQKLWISLATQRPKTSVRAGSYRVVPTATSTPLARLLCTPSLIHASDGEREKIGHHACCMPRCAGAISRDNPAHKIFFPLHVVSPLTMPLLSRPSERTAMRRQVSAVADQKVVKSKAEVVDNGLCCPISAPTSTQ